ncbi:HAMP domain-containing sensor histidine kinase [Clostridium sp. SM-530-WT-3G]|uniref:sensor histidine kinase n=1 Tax=Clostridium sp. SM-530-WT-3G TaxID=2725303 RepID=UPI00145F04DC|nr:HAMP domain-containing sensor histidine kinase [Clostridium sp. SM-530-WT-3G]NME81619.1 HAMP domain-containing histidine kinase [Clostridium sp. SM-530-WT-3G]
MHKINKLSNEIEEAKEIGLKHRINVSDFNDEFDRIAILFNSMMDKLENTFEEKKVFVSNASHELRTPLTALKGHLSMIKRWGKNDMNRMEKSLDICIDETDRLIKISNELLGLMRAEREFVALDEIKEIKVLPIITDCIEHYKILNKNVVFNVDVDKEQRIKILKEHLKQLVIIFIDNAIKYNNKDICNIDIKISENNEKVNLIIIDNGIGIPEDDILYVLNKFYKVDKSRRNNNSYGIGLSIANQIIKNYNGNILISSKENIYTKIQIEFKR